MLHQHNNGLNNWQLLQLDLLTEAGADGQHRLVQISKPCPCIHVSIHLWESHHIEVDRPRILHNPCFYDFCSILRNQRITRVIKVQVLYICKCIAVSLQERWCSRTRISPTECAYWQNKFGQVFSLPDSGIGLNYCHFFPRWLCTHEITLST